ncbi:MAG: YCF48-related protein [Collimonas pratensis]|uniref:YCF48-related protein n=1 Tax=Collimonas pratensis TaxID=279113 RepID=UPI003C73E126
MSISPELPRAGFPVKFTPAGNIPSGTKFVWDFGDGASAANELMPSHIYQNVSVYTSKVTAIDPSGHSSSYISKIEVKQNQAPQIAHQLGYSTNPVAGAPVVLDVIAHDADHDALLYTWIVDGKLFLKDTADRSVTYTFAAGGKHDITVMVSDQFGGSDRLDISFQIGTDVVQPLPPVQSAWQRVSSDMLTPDRVRFLADGTGWAISSSTAQALHTIDNGATWQGVALPKSDMRNAVGFYDIAFADSKNGWVVGCPEFRTEQTSPTNWSLDFSWGRLGQSVDGGKTWSNFPINPASTDAGECLVGIQFIGAKGWILAGKGALIGSTDGGKNWATISNLPIRAQRMQFVDERHGWAIDADKNIARTTDGGKTWAVTSLPHPENINRLLSLSFADQNTGYISVQGYFQSPYKLLKTSDGGVTWAELPVPTLSTIGDTMFVTSLLGYTVDIYGALYLTRNGGIGWDQMVPNQSQAMALGSLVQGPGGALWATSAISTGGGLYKFVLP